MKNLFYKSVKAIVVILLLLAVVSQPARGQTHDFEGWQVYRTYTKMNASINFEAWFFTYESLREAFGLSYIIGYMAGVNNADLYTYFYRDKIKSEKWYNKGKFDGTLDRFLYQSAKCISLHVLFTYYFGFFDYMNPYRAVRHWLKAISYPNFFASGICIPALYTFREYLPDLDDESEIVYVENPTERPTRSSNDYRNLKEHIRFSLNSTIEVEDYEPTDKPTRSPNDYRNIEEHTNFSLNRSHENPEYEPTERPTRSPNDYRNVEEHTSFTRGIDLHPRLNHKISGTRNKNNSVLRQAYQQWPELKRYVKRGKFNNIHIIDSIDNVRPNFDMEKATIEIAIPGQQFDKSYSRRLSRSLNISLPEYDNETVRRTRSTGSRDYNGRRVRSRSSRNSSDRVRSQTTVRTSTRNGNRTRNRQNSSRSRTRSDRVD